MRILQASELPRFRTGAQRCHVQDADVICTTTISSGQSLSDKTNSAFSARRLRSASLFAGGDFFSKFAFAGVLIDEAAQATELAAIVPLILRGADAKQLRLSHEQLASGANRERERET